MAGEDVTIISVGGSLIVPETPDTEFLKGFRELVLKQADEGHRFIIVTGGGKVCRHYQNAARKVKRGISDEDLDWIGIHSTHFNANFMRVLLKEIAHPEIVVNPTKRIDFRERVLVAAGWQPGCSTDYDTVLLAKNFKAARLINMSNVDYVYDKDPDKHEDARPLKDISWKTFREMLPEEWNPGLNAPFDPVAAEEAERLGLEVVIIGGDITNLENYLKGRDFRGTRIR